MMIPMMIMAKTIPPTIIPMPRPEDVVVSTEVFAVGVLI
jgi:hypothetical protein